MHSASSSARSLDDAPMLLGRREPAIVLVEYGDTDAAGESRLVGDAVIAPQQGRLRVVSVFDTSASLRRHIWSRNPHCVECGAKVESPELAGFLSVPDEGVAIACRGACFPRAVARFNPTLDQSAARERDEQLAVLVPDLRLVPDVEED